MTWLTGLGSLGAFIAAIGALLAVWVQRHQDANKPALDKGNSELAKTTVRKLVTELNRDRDIRLWQLEGYVDLDRIWHRKIIVLTERLIELAQQALAAGFMPDGTLVPDATEVPLPPEIPEPPRGG